MPVAVKERLETSAGDCGLGLRTNGDIEACIEASLSREGPNPRLAQRLHEGFDPLGEAFMECNSSKVRRASGSTYTPFEIVESMVDLASGFVQPSVVVDCGCGSGRFALACAREFQGAHIVAIDNSGFACGMCRANAASYGISERIEVIQEDFSAFSLQRDSRPVLWIGNPPYVRHHEIAKEAKAAFKSVAADLGFSASGLAGLHAHFLAAIARQWRDGDFGVLVTSAEWLDVNYGEFMRRVLSERLGLVSIRLFDKSSRVFEAVDSTAVIVAFGRHSKEVEVVCPDGASHKVEVDRLLRSRRWSPLLYGACETPSQSGSTVDDGLVPLGSFVSVHRGVVTGDNKFWVRNVSELDGMPEELTVPVISHAREITGECIAQKSPSDLNRLIVIPEDLEKLSESARRSAQRIIEQGKKRGVDNGYVASRRKRWWAVRPPDPPAALMTYMGRSKPTFVVNEQRLPMLNVVHGLYPKVPMSKKALVNLVLYLNKSVDVCLGRTYCGGLVKFEPKEAEAIMVPPLEALEARR